MIGTQAPAAPPGAPSPPIGGLGAMQPAMVPNPAFAQWQQAQQAWLAEKQKRQQTFLAACELIRGDAVKRYKIDIETDSTIAADEQAEKQARTEFLQAVTPFLEAMVPIAQQNPEFKPLIAELIMFGVRAYPASRSLEDAFETAMQVMQQANTPPPGAAGGKNTKSPMEIQAESAESSGKLQVQQQANAVKMMQMNTEAQIEREKLAAQQQKDATEIALRGREMVGREALEQARVSRIENQNIKGLV